MNKIRKIILPVVILQWLLIYAPIRAESKNFVVIVNKTNPIESISLGELAGIYNGRKAEWDDGSEIAVVNRPADSQIRADFYKAVLGVEPTKKFFIPGTPLPFKTIVQESAKAAKLLVAKMPNAIGYIYADEIDDSVKVIEVKGLSKP